MLTIGSATAISASTTATTLSILCLSILAGSGSGWCIGISLCAGSWGISASGLIRHQRTHELKVRSHELALGLIGLVQNFLDLGVLFVGDLEPFDHIFAKYGSRALNLELNLLEPLDLGFVQSSGELVFKLILKLLHRLAHHLPALGLHGVGRLPSLEPGDLLLYGRVDLTALNPPPIDLGLVAPAVEGTGKCIAGSRSACVDVGVNLRLLQCAGLSLLGRLVAKRLHLLAHLVHHLAAFCVLIVGELLDFRLLTIGQLELFGNGLIAGQCDETASGSSSRAAKAPGTARAASALPATTPTPSAASAGRGLRLRVDRRGRQ